MMNHLDRLENQSIYIIREAYRQYRKVAMLWSIGKDSTTALYLIRKALAKDGEHLRIHPLLGWRELDVWEYIT